MQSTALHWRLVALYSNCYKKKTPAPLTSARAPSSHREPSSQSLNAGAGAPSPPPAGGRCSDRVRTEGVTKGVRNIVRSAHDIAQGGPC